MTRREFRYAMPDIISHKTWGYGELVLKEMDDKRVFAGYEHLNKTMSYETIGSNWKEIFDDLTAHLILENHIPPVI